MGINLIAHPTGRWRAPETGNLGKALSQVQYMVNGVWSLPPSSLPFPYLSLGFFLNRHSLSPRPARLLPTLCPQPGTPFHFTWFFPAHPQKTWKARHLGSRKWSTMTQVTLGACDSNSVSPIKALSPLGLELPGYVIIREP